MSESISCTKCHSGMDYDAPTFCGKCGVLACDICLDGGVCLDCLAIINGVMYEDALSTPRIDPIKCVLRVVGHPAK